MSRRTRHDRRAQQSKKLAGMLKSLESKRESLAALNADLQRLEVSRKELNRSIERDEAAVRAITTPNDSALLVSRATIHCLSTTVDAPHIHNTKGESTEKLADKSRNARTTVSAQQSRTTQRPFKPSPVNAPKINSSIIFDPKGAPFYGSCHECGASKTKHRREMTFEVLYSHYTGLHQKEDGIRRTKQYVMENCNKSYVATEAQKISSQKSDSDNFRTIPNDRQGSYRSSTVGRCSSRRSVNLAHTEHKRPEDWREIIEPLTASEVNDLSLAPRVGQVTYSEEDSEDLIEFD